MSFPDEDTLHSLIEDGSQLLPISGAPNLVMLGRELQLGTGWTDLIAVETSGRIVVIEIKLARNAEARCAVVAQVLAKNWPRSSRRPGLTWCVYHGILAPNARDRRLVVLGRSVPTGASARLHALLEPMPDCQHNLEEGL